MSFFRHTVSGFRSSLVAYFSTRLTHHSAFLVWRKKILRKFICSLISDSDQNALRFAFYSSFRFRKSRIIVVLRIVLVPIQAYLLNVWWMICTFTKFLYYAVFNVHSSTCLSFSCQPLLLHHQSGTHVLKYVPFTDVRLAWREKSCAIIFSLLRISFAYFHQRTLLV